MKGLRILIIDDEPLMRLSIVDALEGVGCEVAAAATGTEGIRTLEKRQFDVVITDLRLPGADGLAILKACKERNPNTEVILITAHGSVDTAIGAMKLGAYDYITKPFQMDELLLIVERVGKMFGLRRENIESRDRLEDEFSFGGLLGHNERMRAVLENVKRIAADDSTVLILGESGTGKELVANAIHLNSARKDRPLVKVTCTALPDVRLESELFGQEKGAVPDATRRRRGRFELAHRGTLFLDEIGQLPRRVQDKLLRVLHERRFERMGGKDTIEVDVRVVCATRMDLWKEAAEGRFRPDLLDKLGAVQVTVPPLRERRDDMLLLAESALRMQCARTNKSLKGFSSAAQDLLLRYSFPENVRELEHLIQRAVGRSREGEPIQPWELCGHQSCPFLGGPVQESCGFCREGLTGTPAQTGLSDRAVSSLAEARERFERDYIVSVLDKAEGNRTAAAQALGLSLKALGEKCRQYQITVANNEAVEE